MAEKGIRELREEMIKLQPQGGKVTELLVAKSTCNLNDRIRHSGCSSRELWTKRDQSSGESLQFEDKELSEQQYAMRLKSHDSSAMYKSRGAPSVELLEIKIGDRIYIKSDQSKSSQGQLSCSQFCSQQKPSYGPENRR